MSPTTKGRESKADRIRREREERRRSGRTVDPDADEMQATTPGVAQAAAPDVVSPPPEQSAATALGEAAEPQALRRGATASLSSEANTQLTEPSKALDTGTPATRGAARIDADRIQEGRENPAELGSATETGVKTESPATKTSATEEVLPPVATEPAFRDEPKVSQTDERRHRQVRGPALKAVIESHLEARLQPRSWRPVSLRYPDDVLDRLVTRMAVDQEATGREGLAVTHYINAALSCAPHTVNEAIKLAWQELELNDGLPMNAPSRSHRIREDTAHTIRRLKTSMRVKSGFGMYSFYVTAAIKRFLDQLDMEEQRHP